MALCLMMAGFSAFSVGFTNSNNGIEVEKVKTIQEISADNFSVAGKDALVQTAEFVNTTREIATENPAEVSIKPINAVEGVENLTYEENINENYNSEEGFSYKAVMAMEATAYLPTDGSGEGLTAMGIPATYGVVAVDPSVIPLGSRVYIPGYGEAIADDTGSAIIGNKIDIAFDTYEEAINFGRQHIEIYILDD